MLNHDECVQLITEYIKDKNKLKVMVFADHPMVKNHKIGAKMCNINNSYYFLKEDRILEIISRKNYMMYKFNK